jgi:hypothetical protein
MQGLDCFVLPSLAEGVSNTVLEAMATGLPVIATRVGANADLVDEGVTGRVVEPGDSERSRASSRSSSSIANSARPWEVPVGFAWSSASASSAWSSAITSCTRDSPRRPPGSTFVPARRRHGLVTERRI